MRRIATLLVTTGIALAVGGPATAAAPPSFSATFTTGAASASSGYRLAIDYRDPSNPEAKPYAVHRIVQTLHAGARIDTSVPPRCEASNQELMAQGEGACPAGTRVGDGWLAADVGQATGRVPRVIENRVVYFNAAGELVLFSESTNAGDPPIRTASRVKVGERTFTSEVPPFPGFPPPDPYLAIRSTVGNLYPIQRGGRAFIRTPPTCPAAGRWTNRADFSYRSGAKASRTSFSACGPRSAGGDRTAPRIAVRGVPRRRCVRRRFRLRARVADRSGIRRAVVRVDGRPVRRTRRRRFAVTIRAARLRGRRHRITVTAVDGAGNRRTVKRTFRRCRS